MKQTFLRAFTLVELIVVISILAIISTIGFISYSSYLVGARDANRIAQISRISDALQTYLTNTNLPLPEGSVELKNEGRIFAYQGSLGQTILQTISYSTTAFDPKDKTPFTYLTNAARNSFQILTHLEDSRNLTSFLPLSHQAIAQYENRFIKVFGSRLGVVVEADTLTPIQQTGIAEFELTSLDTTRYRVYLSDSEFVEGAPGELQDIVEVVRDRGRGWIVQANLLTCFDPEGVFRCSGSVSSVVEKDQYILYYDTQGGNTLPPKLVNLGEAYRSLPTPTRSGYTFNGWFTAASGGAQITSSTTVTETENHTLFAQWTANTYTVSFNTQGGSGGGTPPPPSSCATPWGATVEDSSSITAFQTASVPFGSTCTEETRSCSDGTLSGTYANESCSVAAAASCTLPWGGTLAHGGTTQAFQTSTVPFGSTCTSQTRSCSDGTLSGTYANESCSVEQPPRYPGCNTDDITLGGFTIAACNVGSAVAGTTSASYGRFFQWGENIAWDASSGTASSNNCTWDRDTQACTTPSLSAWSSTVSDTTSGGADRWFDYGDTRGPCAPGYRVPTNSEWITIHTAGGWGSNGTAMQTALKLPFAGYRHFTSGAWDVAGSRGYFWSSSPSSTNTHRLFLTASNVDPINANTRAFGFSVRCLKN